MAWEPRLQGANTKARSDLPIHVDLREEHQMRIGILEHHELWKAMNCLCSSTYAFKFTGILLFLFQYKTFQNHTLIDSMARANLKYNSLP